MGLSGDLTRWMSDVLGLACRRTDDGSRAPALGVVDGDPAAARSRFGRDRDGDDRNRTPRWRLRDDALAVQPAGMGARRFAFTTGTVLITLGTYEGGTHSAGHRRQRDVLRLDLPPGVQLPLAPPRRSRSSRSSPSPTRCCWSTPRSTEAVQSLADLDHDAARGGPPRARPPLETGAARRRSSPSRPRTDGLTGLLNRTSLEERAELELARGRRHGTPVSLIVVDMDGFKAFNDTRGHPAGDELLRAVADGLQRETRQVDALSRPGGDEFAVLLPGASASRRRAGRRTASA